MGLQCSGWFKYGVDEDIGVYEPFYGDSPVSSSFLTFFQSLRSDFRSIGTESKSSVMSCIFTGVMMISSPLWVIITRSLDFRCFLRQSAGRLTLP